MDSFMILLTIACSALVLMIVCFIITKRSPKIYFLLALYIALCTIAALYFNEIAFFGFIGMVGLLPLIQLLRKR